MTSPSRSLEELVETAVHSIVQGAVHSGRHDDGRHLAAEEEEVALHGKNAEELNADNSGGSQGGQQWQPEVATTEGPTAAPSPAPSLQPTPSPTEHPTLHGDPFTLRGSVFYDRNANGQRDSNVVWEGFSRDVEYTHGLGGVTIGLVQCDPLTNREIASEGGDGTVAAAEETAYATGVTQGMDATGHPKLGQDAGRYVLTNIKVNRSYFITATAPQGYLFTYGICNDDVAGWECDYRVRRLNRAERYADKGGRLLQAETAEGGGGSDEAAAGLALTPNEAGNSLGISTGRSTKCISVDKSGFADGPLDLGVMRLGDSKEAVTKVALLLDFDDAVASANSSGSGSSAARDRHRNLIEWQIREQLLRGVQRGSTTVHPHPDARGRTRYLLGEEDKAAIGSVTAEVLAGTLDGRLAENGIELDAVLPKEVLISNKSADGGGADEKSAKDGLAVALEIRGHYSPPPEIDFDYIVQDSINRDTETIRRGLRDYNQNCREQTTMVQEEGYSEQDFAEIHSTSGARPNRGKSSNSKSSTSSSSSASSSSLPSDSVFRTACAQGNNLPNYFETSLKQIQARQVSELDSLADYSDSIIYMNEEARLESWAMGPIAALAGMIVLLMGAFVFRRAMGPRRLDFYKDANKTKRVDTDGRRKFGEAAGPTDDGSVDSAFYSEDDAFSDDHDKRHKRKNKDLQTGKSLRNHERGENGDAEGPHDHHRRGHRHNGKRRSSTRSMKAPGKKRSERNLTQSLASSRSLRSERSQQSSEQMRLSASTKSEDTESLESSNQRSVESLNNRSQEEVGDEGTVEGAASTASTSHGHPKRKKKSKHGHHRRQSEGSETAGSGRKASSKTGSSRDLTAEEGGGKKKKKKDRRSTLSNDADGEGDIV
mmetsp:Transcript_4969/g.10434  ORF Transcript_4969/g.10434 Transcript_4969/m.10434 type:complete len:883 (+) Transcript_4969:271-2919(+)